MFQNYFRMAVAASLATYLLSLAAGVYYKPAYQHLFTEPLAMLKKEKEFSEVARHGRFLWFHQLARDDKKGVVVSDPSRTWGEYTFFSSAWEPKVKLIDLKGNTVHEWTIEWDKIWPRASDRRPETSPLHNVVSRAFLQPNGDVIAEFTGEGGQLGDYGMVRVDKDSKVIWRYDQFANHDVYVMPNGNVLTFIEEIRRTPHPAAPFLKPPFIEPFLAMVDKDGIEVNRVSFYDMFADSPQKKLLLQLDKILASQPANGDIFHPNTITPVTAAAAARNPVFREGQLMLSFRNFNMLAVVDLDTNKITWASYGPWRGQHSPEFIEDGSLVMFDNLGNMRDKGGLSRVLNVDPVSGKILWEYDGTDQDRFYSSYNSAIDALPNGNVLVTETSAGRIFEVTRDKEVVWDYRAPERVYAEGENRIPSLFSGRRFRREDLPFLDAAPAKP
jgi:hypothetical protein